MTQRSLRRIVVALDASAHSHAALEEAAVLAAGLGAELKGIFVLDNELLRYSALPVAHETGLTSSQRRALDPERMERDLKGQAERARSAFQVVTSRHRVRSSFQLSRGNVVSELTEAATRADLFVMGVIGHMDCTGKRLGSTTKQLKTQTGCSLLLLKSGYSKGTAVVAVCDSTDGADRVLELALSLAERRKQDLVLLLCGPESDRGEHGARIRERLGRTELAVTFDAVDRFEELSRLLQRHRGSLLIVGDESPLIAGRDEDLGELGCPVLLAKNADDQATVGGE